MRPFKALTVRPSISVPSGATAGLSSSAVKHGWASQPWHPAFENSGVLVARIADDCHGAAEFGKRSKLLSLRRVVHAYYGSALCIAGSGLRPPTVQCTVLVPEFVTENRTRQSPAIGGKPASERSSCTGTCRSPKPSRSRTR